MCVQVTNNFQVQFLANDACRDLGYPWAFTYADIPYSESPGYVSTGDELVMREPSIDAVYDLGDVRWLRGQDACQMHDYSLVVVECEHGNAYILDGRF